MSAASEVVVQYTFHFAFTLNLDITRSRVEGASNRTVVSGRTAFVFRGLELARRRRTNQGKKYSCCDEVLFDEYLHALLGTAIHVESS